MEDSSCSRGRTHRLIDGQARIRPWAVPPYAPLGPCSIKQITGRAVRHSSVPAQGGGGGGGGVMLCQLAAGEAPADSSMDICELVPGLRPFLGGCYIGQIAGRARRCSSVLPEGTGGGGGGGGGGGCCVSWQQGRAQQTHPWTCESSSSGSAASA